MNGKILIFNSSRIHSYTMASSQSKTGNSSSSQSGSSNLRHRVEVLERELVTLQQAMSAKEILVKTLEERVGVCEHMAGIGIDFDEYFDLSDPYGYKQALGAPVGRGRADSGDTKDTESTLYGNTSLAYKYSEASYGDDSYSSSPNKRRRSTALVGVGGVQKRKSEPKYCTFEGCHKMAHGPTYLFCLRHGGGYRCQEPGCTRSAYSTKYCSRHGGGPRCQWDGCAKGAISNSSFCRRHGGGNRCQHPNCPEGARQGFNFCLNHGGFNPCAYPNCPGIALLTSSYCRQHNAMNKMESSGASIKDE